MKKLIALLLALVMVIGLVACGGEKAPEAAAPEAAPEAAPAPEGAMTEEDAAAAVAADTMVADETQGYGYS